MERRNSSAGASGSRVPLIDLCQRSALVAMFTLVTFAAAGCTSSRPKLRSVEPPLLDSSRSGDHIDIELERRLTGNLLLPE